jgi:hypothetical protein
MAETISDLLFGVPVAGRTCGDCAVCCVLPRIDTPELKKVAGEACPNCTGQGCGIYDTRPPICHAFECAWKRVPDMPPEARPDRLGFMVSIDMEDVPADVFDNLFFMATATQDPLTLRTPLASSVLAALSRSVLPVYIYWDGLKTMVHPPPPLAAAITGPEPLTPEARQWLERFLPYARMAQGDRVRIPSGF